MAANDEGSPLDFDLTGIDAEERSTLPNARRLPNTRSAPPAAASHTQSFFLKLKARGGVAGSLASIALVIAKFIGPLKLVLLLLFKFPLLVTIATMGASIWLEARSFGWPMAAGIVGMIFVHECGHAWAARRLGRPAKAMIFVPFMGAVVFTKGGGTTVAQDAFVGIMGPIFGTGVGLIYVALFFVSRSPVFLELASWTFAINLFNLLPTPPLDGGWIVPVFSPKFMAFGMLLLLLLGVAIHNPLVLILAVLSLPRVIAAWKTTPASAAYFKASSRDRILYGSLYIGLAILLCCAQRYASLGLGIAVGHQVF